MLFLSEYGALLDSNQEIISMFKGDPSAVDFPYDLMWEIHQKNPGHIFEIAHTHPPDMFSLSTTDVKMLKGWAMALYPFPIRMSVITLDTSLGDEGAFVYRRNICYVEPKEMWDRTRKRKIEIIGEISPAPISGFMDELITRSYKTLPLNPITD